MSTDQDQTDTAKPARLSLRDRLHAWWEGYDVPGQKGKRGKKGAADEAEAEPAAASAPVDASSGALNRFGKPLWNATRIQVAEKMWGEGLTSPGGREYTEDLVKPLGLNKTMSVLDLSAGLGGLTRTMHRVYGAWVTGLEANPMLAEYGMDYSRRARLEKQAPIEHYDPNNITVTKRYDAIISKEVFYTVSDKGALFRKLKEITKPHGQLLFIDYVLADADSMKNLKVWADTEPLEPFPITVDETKKLAARNGFDVRVAEDLTARQIGFIASALAILQTHLETHELDLETRQAVQGEVQLWGKRAEALMKGLKLYRFHALFPG